MILVSKSILDAHNGKIAVVSKGENKGSTFTVSFPVTPNDVTSRLRRSFAVDRVSSSLKEILLGKNNYKAEEKSISLKPEGKKPIFFGRRELVNCVVAPLPASIKGMNSVQPLQQPLHAMSRGSIILPESIATNGGNINEVKWLSSSLHRNNERVIQSARVQEQLHHCVQQMNLLPNESGTREILSLLEPENTEKETKIRSDEVSFSFNSSINISSPHVPGDNMDEKKDEIRADRISGDEDKLPRVLVVDDAVSNRKMLCRVLRSRCSVIVEADNGQKAVDIVKESMLASASQLFSSSPLFDLILMDFVMPAMDGPTAILEIRGLGYTGLIFGLTGNVLDSDKQLMITNGANMVLTKPFSMEAFDNAILEHKVCKVNHFVTLAEPSHVKMDVGERLSGSTPRKESVGAFAFFAKIWYRISNLS